MSQAIKPSNIVRLVKEGGWIVLGQIVSFLGSLVLVRAVTEYLEPSQYGQLALCLTLAGLINQVVMGGVVNGVGRYYSIAAERQDLINYFIASFRLMKFATVVVVGMSVAILAGLFLSGYVEWVGIAGCTLFLSLLNGYNSALNRVQNAARQRSVVALHRGLEPWLKILAAVCFASLLGGSSIVIVVSYTVSSVVIIISQSIFIKRVIPRGEAIKSEVVPWIKSIWSYSWPFTAWGGFTWLQLYSDRWALTLFATTEDVGLYSALYQLGYTPIALATGVAISFLGPIVFQRSGDASNLRRNADARKIILNLTFLCMLISVSGFLLAYFNHELIFRLLVSSEFRSVSYLLPWVVLAGGIFASGQILSLKILTEMQSASMTKGKIMTAVLGCALNALGAYVSGLSGVVGALIFFSITYFIWIVWLSLFSTSYRINY